MISDSVRELVIRFFEWSSQLASFVVNWYINHTRDILNVMHMGFDVIFKILLLITVLVSGLYLLLTLTSFTVRKSKRYKQVSDDEALTVAIHIPTRNEICALDCAKACLASDYPMDKVKIYIGDDSDQPEVSRQLKAFADSHKNVLYLKRAQNIGFKPGNLNNMLKYTKEEILIIFDSDFLPGKNVIRNLVTPLVRNPKLMGSQARWEPHNWNQNLTSGLATALNDIFHHIALPVMQRYFKSSVLCGSAEAVRVSKLRELGNWQSGALTEDIEYSLRLLSLDHPIEYLPDTRCKLEVPHRPKDYFKQQMRWSYGVVTALKQHFPTFLTRSYHNVRPKLVAGTLALGYALTSLLLSLLVTGTLSFITHPPGPINAILFVQETSFNIFVTSGLMVAFFIAMFRSGRLRIVPRVFVSSLSIGIITTLFVCNGIYRSLSKKDMQWYLLKKVGKQKTVVSGN